MIGHRMWLDDVEIDPETWRRNNDFDDLDHVFCDCDPTTALCGKDVTGDPIAEADDEPDHPCVVCEDLIYTPCPNGCDDV